MRPDLTSEKAFARAGRLAKRLRDVQQGNGSFPSRGLSARATKKPLEISDFAGLMTPEHRWTERSALRAALARGRRHPCPAIAPCQSLAPSSDAASPHRRNGRRGG